LDKIGGALCLRFSNRTFPMDDLPVKVMYLYFVKIDYRQRSYACSRQILYNRAAKSTCSYHENLRFADLPLAFHTYLLDKYLSAVSLKYIVCLYHFSITNTSPNPSEQARS